jgi:hypothetical protein
MAIKKGLQSETRALNFLNSEKLTIQLKGPCHKIFDLRFFSSNNYIWALGPRIKAFLHMTSFSRRYLTMKSIFLWSVVSMTP